jgi:MoaA/NifB/PqqE/SkfB family radical SAM enzyme
MIQSFLRKPVVKGFPFSLQIEPTNICQLECPTCPTGLGINIDKPGKMQLDDFKMIIDQLKEYLYEIMLFGFGEPLLHKDIYTMIKYASENNIRTIISSNLCSFDETDVDRIINSGLELLVVSLDGITQATYQEYRVKGDVEKVKRNIEMIMKRKGELGSPNPVIQIQFIVMEHNQHEIEKAVDFSRRINVEEFVLKEVGPRFSPKVFKGGDIKLRALEILNELNMCRRLWGAVYVGWNGDVRPCCLTFDGNAGNMLADEFKEIWNNETYIASRRIFKPDAKNICDRHVPCLSCHLLTDETSHSGVNSEEDRRQQVK